MRAWGACGSVPVGANPGSIERSGSETCTIATTRTMAVDAKGDATYLDVYAESGTDCRVLTNPLRFFSFFCGLWPGGEAAVIRRSMEQSSSMDKYVLFYRFL